MTPGPAGSAQAHVPIRTNRYAFAMATEAAPQTVESRLHAPEVTIVIPLLNEEATVTRLWEGIDRTLADSGIAAEVIFVDDGSTDGTMALLERAARARPAGAGGLVQAQLRPAPRHARRHRTRPRADRGDDGRRPPEPAQRHPQAGGRDPRRRRRGQRPAGGAAGRLLPATGAVARHQRAAGATDRRAHLRLRLRLQRLPARRDRAGDAPDRPPEVHQGAGLHDRRVGDGGRPAARRPRRPEPLRHDQADQAGAARADRLLGRRWCSGWGPCWRSEVS